MHNPKKKMFDAGNYSSKGRVNAGAAQGSVPGPLLFSLYTNDLPMSISSTNVDCDMLAEKSSLSAAGKSTAVTNTKLQPSLKE